MDFPSKIKDLADLQQRVAARGYAHDFGDDDPLPRIGAGDRGIVDSISFDAGTDPGDDATLYLLEVGGRKGYLILSDSYHVDPRKAAFIDALLDRT